MKCMYFQIDWRCMNYYNGHIVYHRPIRRWERDIHMCNSIYIGNQPIRLLLWMPSAQMNQWERRWPVRSANRRTARLSSPRAIVVVGGVCLCSGQCNTRDKSPLSPVIILHFYVTSPLENLNVSKNSNSWITDSKLFNLN